MALPGTLAYTASKHAVVGITKTAALEARGHGIRVNAVSPGFLLTKLVSPLVAEGDAPLKDLWKGCVERQGREASFEEVGDVVVLITNPRMSLVNGVNLPIDG
jgi:NAD(P)-dependent dehydrogenase (short-subunit alcohol dehydrogenase family)